MSFFIWSQFAIVCIIGAISPGPSLAVVIRNNINHDRFSGILTSIGHGLGICVYATLAVLGLGIILEANQYIFSLIQILGLIFLFFLGLIFILQKNSNEKIEKYQNQFSSFFQGFTIAIINPKIIIWFTAIYSQFISIEESLVFNIILILTASVIDTLWYILVSILITGYGVKKIFTEKKFLIQNITGIILIFISLTLLYNLIN